MDNKQPFLPVKFTHCQITGGTRMGKTTVLELIAEMQKLCPPDNVPVKIIDLNNSEFIEAVSFALPLNIKPFINYLKNVPEGDSTFYDKYKKTNYLAGSKLEVYHPLVFNETLPYRLPPCFKLFTLPLDFFKDIDNLKVLNNESLQEATLEKIVSSVEQLSPTDTFSNIPVKILGVKEDKLSKIEYSSEGSKSVMYFPSDSMGSAESISRPFKILVPYGIFSSTYFTYKKDGKDICPVLSDERIKRIIMDTDTITAFSTKFIPKGNQKIEASIVNHIAKRIVEVAKTITEKRIRIILVVREARQIMFSEKAREPYKKKVGETFESIVKGLGKSEIKMILDTQLPKDLPDDVSSQCNLKIIFNHDMKNLKDLQEQFTGLPYPTSSNLLAYKFGHQLPEKFPVQLVRQLDKHKFFISCPFSMIPQEYYNVINPPQGNKLHYKFWGHMEEGTKDMELFATLYKESEYYDTKPMKQALFKEWQKGFEKDSGEFSSIKSESDKNAVLSRLGYQNDGLDFKSPNALIVLYFVRNMTAMNEGESVTQSELRPKIEKYMAGQSTLLNNIMILEEKGMIERGVGRKGAVILTDKGKILYDKLLNEEPLNDGRNYFDIIVD